MSDLDEILAVCSLHMGEAEADRLVAWIAERVARPAVLSGDRPPAERLAHVLAHWLSAGERAALKAWLTRRAALGLSLVPARRHPRREPRRPV